MRVFIVGITSGRMYISEKGKVRGRFGPTEQDKLVETLRSIGREAFVGSHIMGSSSMDFPTEDGWPDDKAHVFFEQAFERAFKEEETDASR